MLSGTTAATLRYSPDAPAVVNGFDTVVVFATKYIVSCTEVRTSDKVALASVIASEAKLRNPAASKKHTHQSIKVNKGRTLGTAYNMKYPQMVRRPSLKALLLDAWS
jgi:hypothetical protein